MQSGHLERIEEELRRLRREHVVSRRRLAFATIACVVASASAPLIASAVTLPNPDAPVSGSTISSSMVWDNFTTLADAVTALEASLPGVLGLSEPQSLPTTSVDGPTITPFNVTLETTGRPVLVGLSSGAAQGVPSVVQLYDGGSGVGYTLTLERSPQGENNYVEVGIQELGTGGASPNGISVPTSAVAYIDASVPAGEWTYRLVAYDGGAQGATIRITEARMFAYELGNQP